MSRFAIGSYVRRKIGGQVMRISEDLVPDRPDFVICQWYNSIGEAQAELIRKDDLMTGGEIASIEIRLSRPERQRSLR